MEKLPEDFKQKWVAELRSGNYKQGSGTMYEPRSKSYCCLGVAAVVCGIAKVHFTNNAFFTADEAEKFGYPLELAREWSELAIMNDNGAPFTVIADYIEANL